MNGKKAKLARRAAREELSAELTPVLQRELVITRFKGHDRIQNDPFTVHSFAKQIKKAYNKSRRASATKAP